MSAPVAIHLPKRCTIKLRIGDWSDEFHVDRLAGWVQFYRRLSAGKNARHYEPSLRALEKVQRRIEGAQ